MANKRIKGITIEINGDTTKLSKSLREVDRTISQTATKLRDVEKLLKFNPASSELLKQKQQALGTEINATKQKLDAEKKALEELEKNADGTKENAEQQAALKREIIETTSKLEHLEKQAAKASSVLGTQMQVAGKKVAETGDKITDAGKKLSKVSAGFAAVGVGALKLANDYETGLNKVNTIAGLTGKEFDNLGKNLLKVSSDTGKSATEITEAAYQALSASVPTDKVTGFVETASKLSKAGFTETATAVDILTTAINAYGLNTDEAATIANKLVQVQNDGKTTVDQLAASMGKVIPIAAATGVNLDNVSAAYVTLTKQGISTANSTTMLRGLLNELSKDGSDVSGVLKEQTGKSFTELMNEGKSLGDVIGILSDSVNGDSTALKNMFGNVNAGTGALAIANQGTKAFNDSLKNVDSSAGNVDTALQTMSTSTTRAKKSLNAAKNSATQLGQQGLVALSPVLDEASAAIGKLTEKFNSLSPAQQQSIVKFVGIGAVIGPATVAVGSFVKGVGNIATGVGKAISGISSLLVKLGLKTAAETADTAAQTANTTAEAANTAAQTANAAAQGTSAAATTASGAAAGAASGGFLALNASMLPTILIIGGIVLAVAAVITIIVLLVKNWDKVVLVFKKGAEKIKAFMSNMKDKITNLFKNIGAWFGKKFGDAVTKIKEKFGKIGDFFNTIKEKLRTVFSKIGTTIGGAISGAFKRAINGALSLIEGYLNMVPNAINGVLSLINKLLPKGSKLGKIPTIQLPRVALAEGGVATSATNAIVGEGKHPEAVLPLGDPRTVELFRKALAGVGNGATVNQTINVGQMSSYREAYMIRRATEQGIKKMMRATV